MHNWHEAISQNPLTTSIELPGYNIEQTPSELSAGATQKNWNLISLNSKSLINKVAYWVLSTSTLLWSTLSLIMNIWKRCLGVITHENKICILTGHFNLNLLKHAKSPGVTKFLENLLWHSFMPRITLPTRIAEKTATLIDNILINNNALNCICGNITTSISDHLPQFIVLASLLGTPTDEDSSQIWYRSFKNFNEENFSNDINKIN